MGWNHQLGIPINQPGFNGMEVLGVAHVGPEAQISNAAQMVADWHSAVGGSKKMSLLTEFGWL